VRRTKARLAKARTRDSTQTLAKLTTVTDRRRRIISDPPLIVPLEELAARLDVDAAYWFLRRLFTGHAAELADLPARAGGGIRPDPRGP
jgi:hypothetical protein